MNADVDHQQRCGWHGVDSLTAEPIKVKREKKQLDPTVGSCFGSVVHLKKKAGEAQRNSREHHVNL